MNKLSKGKKERYFLWMDFCLKLLEARDIYIAKLIPHIKGKKKETLGFEFNVFKWEALNTLHLYRAEELDKIEVWQTFEEGIAIRLLALDKPYGPRDPNQQMRIIL